MNDEEMEARLGSLAPAEAPSRLRARLAEPPARRNRLRWLRWGAPLAAAAAVALALIPRPWGSHAGRVGRSPVAALLPRPHPRVNPSPPAVSAAAPSDFLVFIPVDERRTLIDVSDFRVIPADSDNLVRLVRCTWVDDITYRGDDGATLHRREPREQIIPVALESL